MPKTKQRERKRCTFEEGDELPNGATVHDSTVAEFWDDGNPKFSIVLCSLNGKYVTWLWNHDAEASVWGDYFSRYVEALHSYADRIEKRW